MCPKILVLGPLCVYVHIQIRFREPGVGLRVVGVQVYRPLELCDRVSDAPLGTLRYEVAAPQIGFVRLWVLGRLGYELRPLPHPANLD